MRKLSDIIERLKVLEDEHGNLECFDSECHMLKSYDITIENGEDYPTMWNMPKKFVRIGTD